MNSGPAKKISISSQPPSPLSDVRPISRRVLPYRRDSDTDYVERTEKAVAALAQEVDECLKSGRTMRELILGLAKAYEFFDREKFVDELCEKVEKFPETRSKINFIVSIFSIYEYTNHQDLAIRCADFSFQNSNGSHAMASACSTLLCRIVDNCILSGAGKELCRDAIEKAMGLSSAMGGSPFSTIRPISEVSTFCRNIRLKTSEDSQPGMVLGTLPLQEPNLLLTFLAALENVISYAKERPEAINEFIASCMEMAKAWKPELFVSAVSILAWAAKLDKKENEGYIRETLVALQSWDQSYLSCMEANLSKEVNPPKKR